MDLHVATSDLRASDADRHQIFDALSAHTAAGRLTLDEFTVRLDAVNQAKTYRELAMVTADLPTTHTPVASGSAVRGTVVAHARPTAAAIAVLAVVLAVLLVGTMLAAMAGWGHMDMMGSMTDR